LPLGGYVDLGQERGVEPQIDDNLGGSAGALVDPAIKAAAFWSGSADFALGAARIVIVNLLCVQRAYNG
jgi:hypothetical protein